MCTIKINTPAALTDNVSKRKKRKDMPKKYDPPPKKRKDGMPKKHNLINKKKVNQERST